MAERKKILNPVTRISGFLEIEVEIQSKTIVNAKSSGLLYRGFEEMLRGRPPLDATYFTERICGICSTAHAMASTLALEQALQIQPGENEKMIRDFMHGCEFLQNHFRHFYQYSFPDFVKGPEIYPLIPRSHDDYRIPERVNQRLVEHYLASFKYSRLAHEMLAVLGGKVPHTHGIFVGGVTVNLDVANWLKVKSILSEIYDFLLNCTLEDVQIIAEYYPEYFELGGGYGNLMSYGLFDQYNDQELSYVQPGVCIDGVREPFDPGVITENIYYAWYQAPEVLQKPGGPPTEPDLSKPEAYSWIKAPRYRQEPMEVGPLARMVLSGIYTRGISTMDRTIARVLELKKMIEVMQAILERVELKEADQRPYSIPEQSLGVGLVDTTRGALGHWLSIKDQRLYHYDIITPTVWNLSPEDSCGIKGVVEAALMGTYLDDISAQAVIGRIVRSFDPCVSCATHILGGTKGQLDIHVI